MGAGVGPRRFLELGGVLEEGIPDGEGGGCLGYGDSARDDTGIVAAVDRELGIFHGVHIHGLLLTTDGGRRLHGHAPHDGCAGGDAAQNAAGVIGGLGDMTGCIGSKCIIVDRPLRPGS